MPDKVKYKNRSLEIHYDGYGTDGRNYGELFDFLGDFDIVTASEIGQDVIIMSGIVFLFSPFDESRLRDKNYVQLPEVGSLNTFIDLTNKDHIDFYNWYYGN